MRSTNIKNRSSQKSSELIRLKIPSNPKYISTVRVMIEDLAKKNGFAKQKIDDLKLAINEALANVIEHAYNWQKNKVIFIYIVVNYRNIEIVIKDFGRKVTMKDIKSRSLEDFRDGGLGVFLIQNMVDDVQYNSLDVGTELKITKNK